MRNFALVGLMAILTTPALGQEPSSHERLGPKQMFERLDANDNGVVTHAEFMIHNAQRFSEFDADADGFLTLEELPETMPIPLRAQRRLAKRQDRTQKRLEQQGVDANTSEMPERARRLRFIARLDKDGDERLSVEEFAAPPLKRFKFADVNGDGQVTDTELNTALAERAHRPRSRRPR